MSEKVALGAISSGQRERIEEILRSSGLFRDDEVDVALELFNESVKVGRESDYLFFGAYDSAGALMGFACYGPTPDTDRTFDLYWIAVDQAAQGAGCGTTLLSEVERRLKDEGARMVVVETSSRPDYEGTRNFYLRRDYKESARIEDFYGPSDGRVIFTKRFQPDVRQRLAAHGVMSQ